MRSKTASYLILICAVTFSAGCASTGAKTGYLENYDSLKRGSYLQGIHVSPSASSVKISSIKLASIDTSKTPGTETVSPGQASADLSEAIQRAVKVYGESRYVFDPGAQADATLELAITEINPGSRAGRFWGGEFGAGHAYVQVEGKLIGSSGVLLASFSEKRRSSGMAGAGDTFQDMGPQLIKDMLNTIANDMVRELKSV